MKESIRKQLAARTFVTEGGTETYLLFQQGFALRDFCTFELFLNQEAFDEMERSYLYPIADAVSAAGHGLLYYAGVWRASPDWVVRCGYREDEVHRFNALAIEKTREALARWRSKRRVGEDDMPIVVGADIGPRGDGYTPDIEPIPSDEARDYHRIQMGHLAEIGVDVVTAFTMTTTNETIGLVQAAEEFDLPILVSATVETNGRLPDGTTLAKFVEDVDQATKHAPLFYMVNCAHPTHLLPVLLAARQEKSPWLKRLRGFRANASSKSHAELDCCTTLDAGDPVALGEQIAAMQRDFGLQVIGGCCGTDPRHIAAIARAAMGKTMVPQGLR